LAVSVYSCVHGAKLYFDNLTPDQGPYIYLDPRRVPPLKVDGNENEGGGDGYSSSGSVCHCGDRGLF
jgi:hypothetical protein